MVITVFGASGKVGRLLTAELLKRGHSVRAFVHSASLPDQDRLEIVKGDIHSRQDVEQAIQGAGAVISALGSWGTKDKNIVSTAMTYIVPAMQAQSISRIVTLTGNAASYPGEKLKPAFKIIKAFLNMVAPKILRDGEDHIALLAGSKLDYTVVRSPAMISFGTKNFGLHATDSLSNQAVHRQAVAIAMADLIESHEWSRQCPYISRAS